MQAGILLETHSSLREAEASLTVQEKQQLKEQAAREEKQKKNDWFR
jgi:hypothetical protein